MKHRLPRRSARPSTNPTRGEFSKKYTIALENYLKKYSQGNLQDAHHIGELAAAISLDTLQMAKIHEDSLVELQPSNCSLLTHDERSKRAMIFFTEAIMPIEKTHPTALNATVDLKQLDAKLFQQTNKLTFANNELSENIALRQIAKKAFETHREMADKLLCESRQLHQRLQVMNRRFLTAQEEDRKTMSHILQDEIAQAILGIQIRLLALKKEISFSNIDLQKEIAITQQWVEKSVRAISRSTQQLGSKHGK